LLWGEPKLSTPGLTAYIKTIINRLQAIKVTPVVYVDGHTPESKSEKRKQRNDEMSAAVGNLNEMMSNPTAYPYEEVVKMGRKTAFVRPDLIADVILMCKTINISFFLK